MAAAVVLAGCSTEQPQQRQLQVHIAAGPVAFDSVLALTVSGADPGSPVEATATAADAEGTSWQSQASFTPAGDGTVDVARSAPLPDGSYSDANADGLIWSMGAGQEHPQFATGPDATMTVTFTASQAGASKVSARQQRTFTAPAVRTTMLTQAADGFVGNFYALADRSGKRPAVVVLGGSEGGLPVTLPRAFAAKGIQALAVAYFGSPGLPRTLADIPLEYVATALRWLARQPGVDPGRIAVIGGSRGSEAALLLGVHFPDLVHAVIAGSPSSVVGPGFPDPSRPAWTLGGRPLPYVTAAELGQATPADPAVIIPVERIRGPVLTLCGEQDQLWPSCAYADAITARRRQAGLASAELREPGAGHLIGFTVPNLPSASGTVTYAGASVTVGGTVQSDTLARLAAWPQLVTFLQRS